MSQVKPKTHTGNFKLEFYMAPYKGAFLYPATTNLRITKKGDIEWPAGMTPYSYQIKPT